MSDPVWKDGAVQSPCVRICVVHPAERICTGCLRTLEEIAAWSTMNNDERISLIAQLPNREGRLKKRRGGRAARLKGAG